MRTVPIRVARLARRAVAVGCAGIPAAIVAAILVVGGAAICAAIGAAPVQARGADEEYAVKAAFLYNFAKFTTWPAGAFPNRQAPLVLCILGDNPFGGTIATLDGKPVGDRVIQVREAAVRDTGPCHLLFVSRSLQGQTADLLRAVRGRPVLTVGDQDGFARSGGAINLTLVDERVRFEINTRVLAGTGITLSSQVLRLAKIVEEDP